MKWYDGDVKVVNIIDETKKVKRFFVELVDSNLNDILDFIPGQFVELILPIDDDIKKCSKHYSIASTPNNSTIEFIINKVEGGISTEYLFSDKIIINDTKWKMIAPLGQFVLPTKIDTDITFLCTGTGVAPFRSMINHLFSVRHNEIINRNITLIYGCRTQHDILYYQEFNDLALKYPNFNYYIALSRDNSNDINIYSNNRIQNVITEIYDDNNILNTKFFICGTYQIIESLKQFLNDKKVLYNNIKIEVYL
jgi:CDP-4-dehydro-6-deoxyglucose reductase